MGGELLPRYAAEAKTMLASSSSPPNGPSSARTSSSWLQRSSLGRLLSWQVPISWERISPSTWPSALSSLARSAYGPQHSCGDADDLMVSLLSGAGHADHRAQYLPELRLPDRCGRAVV